MKIRIAAPAIILLALAGCTQAQITAFEQKVQPVAAAIACDAQKAANMAGAAATILGQAAAATAASLASQIAGTWCNDLTAGAPLPAPVPVTGTTVTLPTTTPGVSVTMPVPVAAGT